MRSRLSCRGFKEIFDGKRRAVNKAYAMTQGDEASLKTYYYELGISSIVARLQSISGRRFRNAAFIGPCADWFHAEALQTLGLEAITVVDDVKESVDRSLRRMRGQFAGAKAVGVTMEEDSWPFPENYFDLIVNNLQLHWVNNVHTACTGWLKSLQPDGALIGAAMGGDTLQELRIALSLSEQEREGGISAHVSPMLTITDLGNVLNRSEYRLITTTADTNTLLFDDSFSLMEFLREVGESNAVLHRRNTVSRETFLAAESIYRHLFAYREGEHKGKLPATFDVMHYIGWREHSSQQKPLKPGTPGINLKDLAEAVGDEDIDLGEIIDKDGKIKVKYLKSRKPRT